VLPTAPTATTRTFSMVGRCGERASFSAIHGALALVSSHPQDRLHGARRGDRVRHGRRGRGGGERNVRTAARSTYGCPEFPFNRRPV
jgi:hypothetical protein